MFYVVRVNLCREELCTAHTVFVTYSVSRSMLASLMIYDNFFKSFPINYACKITHLFTMFLSYEMSFYMDWKKNYDLCFNDVASHLFTITFLRPPTISE